MSVHRGIKGQRHSLPRRRDGILCASYFAIDREEYTGEPGEGASPRGRNEQEGWRSGAITE